jgi:hypothetical protein
MLKKYIMKTTLILLILLIPCSLLFGQITNRDVSEKAISKPRNYDSLSAFAPREDLRIYIGQELFFLPKSKKWKPYSESYGISFSLAPTEAGGEKKDIYHAVQGSTKYSFSTDSKQISGKYFIVDNFIDKSDKDKYKFEELGLYFKLVSKEHRDTAYYQIAKVRQHLSNSMIIPFIVVGHFEYLKKLHLGKKFQAQQQIQNVSEINSGQSINCEQGSWWECVDFTLVDMETELHSRPVLIFRNDRSEEILVEAEGYEANTKAKRAHFLTPEEIEEKRRSENLQSQELAQQKAKEEQEKKIREVEQQKAAQEFRQDCINKYGAKYGNHISEGKVLIGMTKEMCRLAWGDPNRVNKTTTSSGTIEQWVYSLRHYLYFTADKLTAIQN